MRIRDLIYSEQGHVLAPLILIMSEPGRPELVIVALFAAAKVILPVKTSVNKWY
jgi:hypothetical protein